MAFKVFLDANVLLDFMLKRAGYEPARKIIALAVAGRIRAFITPSIVQITGYWLTKAYGHAKAKELLLSLLTDITCMDISHENAIKALHSSIKDIEDALQYYAAMHHKMDYFISMDKQLQKEGTPVLPVYPPEKFLKEMGGQ